MATTPKASPRSSNSGTLLTEPTNSGTLVNCQVSLNHAALPGLLRPIFHQVTEEQTSLGERLGALEQSIGRLHIQIEHKAEAQALCIVEQTLREHQEKIMQKADMKGLQETRTQLAHMNEQLALKADLAVVEDFQSSLQLAQTLAMQKADLHYVNRTNAQVQKLTTAITQLEKQSNEALASIEKFEGLHVLQKLQRTKDMMAITNNTLNRVQDALLGKADQRCLDELSSQLEKLEGICSWKASHQEVLDVGASLHDVQHQLVLKVDQLALEEARADLLRLQQIVAAKAEVQDVQQALVGVETIQQGFSQKADMHSIAEIKTRLLALEASSDQKVERQQLAEVCNAVATIHQGLSLKADRQLANDSALSIERLQHELLQKADTQFVNENHAWLQRLQAAVEVKVDATQHEKDLDEFDQRVGRIIEQMRNKAEQGGLEEVRACMESMTPRSRTRKDVDMSRIESSEILPTAASVVARGAERADRAEQLWGATQSSSAGAPQCARSPSTTPPQSRPSSKAPSSVASGPLPAAPVCSDSPIASSSLVAEPAATATASARQRTSMIASSRGSRSCWTSTSLLPAQSIGVTSSAPGRPTGGRSLREHRAAG